MRSSRKREQHALQVLMVRLHVHGQHGAHVVEGNISGAKNALYHPLRGLERGGHYGRTHQHSEPYDVDACGWCSNIRYWRRVLRFYELALPVAKAYEAEVRLFARDNTQRATVELARDKYPHMRRTLVRALWKQAKEGK